MSYVGKKEHMMNKEKKTSEELVDTRSEKVFEDKKKHAKVI